MIQIDWNQLKQNSVSKEISFEKFCYQVARALFKNFGKFTYPYNMAGSEFSMELTKPLEYEGITYPVGAEICWQAKFWTNQNDLENTSFTKSRRAELTKGFKDTCACHPNMALWILCTPGMVVEKAYNELKKDLAAINNNVEITHWHKSVFEGFFVEEETKYQGIAALFFGKYYLNYEKVVEFSRATIKSLEQKFDVELHTETSFEKNLMSVVDTDAAEKMLKERLKMLCERLDEYDERWTKEEKKHRRSNLMPENVLSAFEDYEMFLLTIGRRLCDVDYGEGFDEIVENEAKILESSYKHFYEVAKKLEKAIDDAEEDASYSFSFYAEDILTIKDIIYCGEVRRTRSIDYAIGLRKCTYFPVFAQAGYGKTHFACAIANKLLSTDHPVLLLTGNRFRHCNRPQEVFLQLFEVEGKLTFDELLGALDSLAGCYSGMRMPIIIDGLNESFPGDAVWKEELPLLINAIDKTDHLFLITTCREKCEYIQRIYGKYNYDEVENYILLEGIEDTSLAETIRKYFAKYAIKDARIVNKTIFKNPLLLKIFCEANEGAKGLVVNEYSLAECMKHYSNKLVNNIAMVDEAVDKGVKHALNKGLVKMGQLLWERNTRTLDYWKDFREIFDDKTESLIEEGVCFQIDFHQEDSEVKFTYDLMAGYHMACYLIDPIKDVMELGRLLNTSEVFCKLFGGSDELHTLSEDIVKSLVYLVAEKYNKDLFDLVSEDAALSKILGNFDFICGCERGRRSLEKRLELPLGKELKKSICGLVKEKVQNYQSVFGINSLLPAFLQMNSEELDILFHSNYLGYGAMDEVVQCIKKHLKEDAMIADALTAAFLFSGTFVREERQELINRITLFAEMHFEQAITIAKTAISIADPFIREAVYYSVVGAAVRSSCSKIVKQAIELLSDDMREHPTSHIVLLDLLDSLMDYAKVNFLMDVDKQVLFWAKDKEWPQLKEEWHSSLYEYEFEKFHLRPYSSLVSYRNRSPYSSDDLWWMIVKRMKDKGYDDEVYSKREKELSDNRRYWRGAVDKLACKHRDSVQKELVGWLLMNGVINPEYEDTLRTSEINIDPSYPTFSPKRCLDTCSYLCRKNDKISSWLNKNPLPQFEDKLCTCLPGSKYKWILLKGYVSQKNEEREKSSSFYWSVKSCLNWNTIKSHRVEDLGSKPSHLFAFEIGWREMKSTEEDYFDPGLGIPLLNTYEFSAWNNERDKVPDFCFINENVVKETGLMFSLKDLSYYRRGEKMVEIYQSDSSMYYYLRQDVLEEILEKFNVHLDFEMYADKTDLTGEIGNRTFKRFKKIYTYEKIIRRLHVSL